VVVLGGTGFFGGAAVELLRGRGIPAITAARRRGAELHVDAEDADSLRQALRPGDIVLDAAGPFQRRTTVLAETAIELGLDVVDIADSLDYVERVLAHAEAAGSAGVRLLPACSTASVVSSAMVAWSDIEHPVELAVLLVPTTRRTAVSATASSLLSSVGRPIRILEDGRWSRRIGFGETRRWEGPLPGVGGLFETPDGLMLPRAHPTLSTVSWYVDPNIPGVRALLGLAAGVPLLRQAMQHGLPLALPIARALGSDRGGLAAEVRGVGGEVARVTLTAPRNAYRMAVLPAVLAVRALLDAEMDGAGVIPVHRQLPEARLLTELERLGFSLRVDRA
jgi:saccharopine dehydrogenase-like NADP-dependent oxidoreductase